MITPNLIIFNARIYTMDQTQPWVSALAIQDHRVFALGSDMVICALASPDTQLINAEGRVILPGLCDAHIHFYDWSLGRSQVQLAGTKSKAEMLARIQDRAQVQSDQAWIIGRGWNESFWGESHFPDRHDLDKVTGPKQAAIFWRSDMHAAVANTSALALAGITADTPNPPGGVIDRDANGQPTGVLRELAIALVREVMTENAADREPMVEAGMRHLHQFGITALHDQRMKAHDDGPQALAVYQRLRRRDALNLRINCNIAAHDLPHLQALNLQSGFGDDYLRLGHVKVFSDGSLGSRTAWMLHSFEKDSPDEADNLGVSVTPPEQMAAEFRQATELGFPISVHAIGDRANRVCLDIFEELAASQLTPPVPHRIEHVQTLDPADIPRLAKLQHYRQRPTGSCNR